MARPSRSIGQVDIDMPNVAKAVSAAGAGDTQRLAAALMEVLTTYYNATARLGAVLLGWALALALLGLVLLLSTAGVLPALVWPEMAAAGTLAGRSAEILAGGLLLLHGICVLKMGILQRRWDRLQCFLLAGNLSQSLPEPAREQARILMIERILGQASLAQEVRDALARREPAVVPQPAETVPGDGGRGKAADL